ncbi:MAG: hypothetical protein KBC57_02180 [Neisseriaceae bacterium]|nr:hypothetical protein [Neisseriaceae bacterium]MBP6861149.1 hypothetical protein [Neisseriaceae bacterium]
MKPYPKFRVILAYFFSAGIAGFMVACLFGLYDLFKTVQPFHSLGEHLLSVLNFGLIAALLAQAMFAIAALLLGVIACVFKMQKSVRHYLILTLLGGLFSALTVLVVDFTPTNTLGFYALMGAATAWLTARLCLPNNGVCTTYDPN